MPWVKVMNDDACIRYSYSDRLEIYMKEVTEGKKFSEERKT
jgi:hypothetical protein